MKFVLAALTFAAIFFFVSVSTGHAVECPSPPPGVAMGCKIITLNPAEELSLLGPSNILDAAAWARRMELEQVITYWREKLKNAPAGDPPAGPPSADKDKPKQ